MKYYNVKWNISKIIQNRCILHSIHTYKQPGRLLVPLNNPHHNNKTGKVDGLSIDSPCNNQPGIIDGWSIDFPCNNQPGRLLILLNTLLCDNQILDWK